MQLKKSTELLLGFNRRLNNLVQVKANSIEFLERLPKNVFIAMIIGKVIKTHNAILILCQNGYGEDASVLNRTLLEILLDALYILKTDGNEIISRYNDYHWIVKKHYLQVLSSYDDAIGYKEVDKETKNKIENQAVRAQKKYNYQPNRWSDKSKYNIAKQVGLLADYEIAYKVMSGFVHTDALALDNYASLDKDTNFIIDWNPSDNNIDITLVSSFAHLFRIVSEWNELLQVKMGDDLKKLEDEYIDALQAIKNG